MTIEILPARLANQIAAGEVVERPASVIKELVENSLDAGATKIQIDVEKGGAKRLRIIDNGAGIAKNELTLALSRHATSKIKSLNDLEAISSLGFRGEALASISSVSRLTLTSKPVAQESAWQANAQGRDMDVTIQPAAHPDGTTIDVKDLFFNTPARRKFLRTEKTEFTHIEEVIRRIALACLNVTFILTHNGKIIRQYRAAQNKSQYAKRIAQICGQKFVDNAIEVDCLHSDLHLWGWLAKPSYFRNQNDLSYSYVNGRMMRDKLINHAIRQAYANLLPPDAHSAFVLFLELDFREVDVNVHPAKHEVRFHQGRYIHDFIFSVCNKALQSELNFDEGGHNHDVGQLGHDESNKEINYQKSKPNNAYITPLTSSTQQVNEASVSAYCLAEGSIKERKLPLNLFGQNKMSARAAQVYQGLMTPHNPNLEPVISSEAVNAEVPIQTNDSLATNVNTDLDLNTGPDSSPANQQIHYSSLTEDVNKISIIQFVDPGFGVIKVKGKLRLLSLIKLSQTQHAVTLSKKINETANFKWISQPLLLPVKITIAKASVVLLKANQNEFARLGFNFDIRSTQNVEIKGFPALLRDKDISKCFTVVIEAFNQKITGEQAENKNLVLTQNDWCEIISQALVEDGYNQESAQELLSEAEIVFSSTFERQLLLNSVEVDLTSEIEQLM